MCVFMQIGNSEMDKKTIQVLPISTIELDESMKQSCEKEIARYDSTFLSTFIIQSNNIYFIELKH